MTLLKLKIRCSTGEDFSIEIEDGKTVLDLKNEIEKQFNVPASSQRLIYRGRILQDDRTCNEYGIQTEQTVHMVKAKTATSNTATSAPSAPTSSTTTPAGPSQPSTNPSTVPPSQPPQNPMFGFGANPFGLPVPPPGTNPFSPENLQAQAQQLMQNPEMMRNMMENPMVQSMLSNPDFLRNMINQNPQMREILESNPELSQVLNNPEVMRQTMELMSNPATLQEVLRSNDQAIANLTSMEGGFDALRRMYTQVQEPMMEAADSANRTATPTAVPSQPPSTLYSDAVPNPWGAAPASSPSTTVPPPPTPAAAASSSSSVSGTPGAVPGTSTTLPPAPSPFFANMMNMFGAAPPATGTTPSATVPPAPSATPGATATGTGSAQPPPPSPFGAGGFPGGMPNMNNPAMLQQMLSNPATQAMMQQMMNDPNMIEMMINMNPMIRDNPMLCNMLRNPAMRAQLFNPQTLQAAMSMQQMFGNPAAGGVPGAADTTGASAPGVNPYFNPMFMAPPTTSTVPPREQYASQLEELKSMGFYDEEENLRILQLCHGNINMAVDRLLQK